MQKEDLKPNEVMEKPVEEEKKPMAPEQVKVEEHKFVEPVLEGKEQKDEKVVEQKSEEKLEVGNVNKVSKWGNKFMRTCRRPCLNPTCV